MAFSWERFFTNWRNLTSWPQHYVEEGAKSVLSTPPTSVIQPLWKIAGQEEPSSKKPYQQVWGFDQDKANYGNERNGDSLTWRDLSIHNNDTDEDFSISVGYDSDGKISGVRKNENGNIRGYYGQDLVGDFFKNNFDRDATDYTVFDAGTEGDSRKWVLFDSKHDGPFIPSYALSSERRSQPLTIPEQLPDKPTVSVEEGIDDIRNEQAVRRGTLYTQDDEDKMQAAENSMLYGFVPARLPQTRQEIEFFENNSNDFIGMAMEFSRTPSPQARMQILEKAYSKYGSLPRFAGYLEQMAEDEKAYADGLYPNYDYKRVGAMIADAIDGLYRYMYHYV